jgi:hypothetical protein
MTFYTFYVVQPRRKGCFNQIEELFFSLLKFPLEHSKLYQLFFQNRNCYQSPIFKIFQGLVKAEHF